MNIYVDTREPIKIRTIARKLGFIPMALDVGDYSTDSVIIERKEINDLVNSIFARYGGKSRLLDQAERMWEACQQRERILMLLITGKISKVEEQFKKRGQTLNRNAIYGAVASIMCRYTIDVFWTEQPTKEWLKIILSFCHKVDEGKYMLPRRKKLKEFARNRNIASISRSLELSPKLSGKLVKKFGSLYSVLYNAKHHPSEILVIDGIGKRTYQKIRELGGIT